MLSTSIIPRSGAIQQAGKLHCWATDLREQDIEALSRYTTRREVALWYAERLGWLALPARGKRPIVKWKDDVLPEMPPLAALAEMWRRDHHANIAVLTGMRSGIVVGDVDPRHGGRLEALWERGWPRETPIAQSGSGGWHVYCRCPAEGVRSMPTYAPGIELKAEGALVIAPPSTHPDTGRRYTWRNGYEPWTAPLAPLPEEVLDGLRLRTALTAHAEPPVLSTAAVRRLARKAPRLVRQAIERARTNRDGGRHLSGLWLACQLRDLRVSDEVGRACMLAYQREVEVLHG